MAAKKPEDDRSLKRLGGGRWQTRDERFTIEPQSGTWVIVDAEQTDDLGLPLVRGPYRSLTDAKAAAEKARGTEAPASPLAERVKQAGARSSKTQATKEAPSASAVKGSHARAAKAEEPAEPRWIAELAPRDRGRARRLIEQLGEAGVRDPAGVVRQDLGGGVPTVARFALAERIATLLPSTGKEASAVERTLKGLVEALDEGRDEELGVRWRLVDGDDRPIGLGVADLRAALKRRAEGGEKEKDR